ncbi:MAG TPA: ArsA family ATPase [Polyangiaceae bacterium]|jgi:anion-transporting  ArsA/GET3 family ATPase|nr:ArsA family ATPase [Polyangiaceae bacterium]
MRDFDRKFLFVTGKGGVGKSTVAAALALALAGRQRNVLLALCEPGPSARLLGTAALGPQIQRVSEHLSAVVIDPNSAVREYGEMFLPSALSGALMGNRYSRAFLAAVPGLHPWAMLGKAWYHTTENVAGRARFDHVVFDAPATGHALQMLQVPKVISMATAPGVLKRDAERAWEMLRDPTQARAIVVTLAELLPVLETLELVTALANLGMPDSDVILNATPPELFDEVLSRELDALSAPDPSAEQEAVLAIARERRTNDASVRALRARLSEQLGRAPFVLPEVPALNRNTDLAPLVACFSAHS